MNNYNLESVTTRRVFAFLLDVFLCFALTTTVLIAVTVVLDANDKTDLMNEKLIEQILSKYGVLLILRDFLCGGTSLGKRIVRLRVIDYNTHQKPPVLKRILRDLFVIILPVEIILLCMEGRTLGDKLANTMVVHKNDVRTIITPQPDINTEAKNKSKRSSYIVVFGIIALFVIVCSIGMLAVRSSRNTEQYKIAYDYIVNSEVVKENGYTEKQIHHHTYSSHTYTSADGESDYRTEIGFRIRFKDYSVILHKDETDNWYVCDECTDFK